LGESAEMLEAPIQSDLRDGGPLKRCCQLSPSPVKTQIAQIRFRRHAEAFQESLVQAARVRAELATQVPEQDRLFDMGPQQLLGTSREVMALRQVATFCRRLDRGDHGVENGAFDPSYEGCIADLRRATPKESQQGCELTDKIVPLAAISKL
jgi:hypothetical protein